MEADPLITTGEVSKEPSIDHPTVFWHLKQIEKPVPHELTTSQKKNRHFEVWSYSMQQQQTISQSDCDA